MRQVGEHHFLVETPADLPEPKQLPLYLDNESRSHDDSLRSSGLFPYKGDKIAMTSIAYEGARDAFAVPVRMRDSMCNIPVDTWRRWMIDVMSKATAWRNHNPKFDWHFNVLDGIEIPDETPVECTLTLAKIIDSDRWSHNLKDLAREWLSWDYASEDKIRAWLDGYKLPRGAKAKCYALVPTDLLAQYACDDVLATRALYEYCSAKLEEMSVNGETDLRPTWEMEKKLTLCLFDMERIGLKTDERDLKIAKYKSLHRMIKMSTRIKELTGREFVDSSKFSFGLLVGAWGLPILSRDKKSGNPSFDKDALKLYQSHPEVVIDPLKRETLDLIMSLREEETYSSLFVDTFIDLRDRDGRIHSQYNQLVRTGRMSCKAPNSQQWDDRAKELIVADEPGYLFLDNDASQLEFRFIVHYIKDPEAIHAYNNDPKTDFHAWAANMCRIDRPGGKTMNFSVSFGQGKTATVAQLATNEMVIKEVTSEINSLIERGEITESQRIETFKKLCFARGESIFDAYHERFPGIKQKSRKAMHNCRQRGYVFNLYGRRRHLPLKAAHVSFNTICQGGAADYVKRRIIATAPRFNPEMRADGVTQRATIHDEILHHGHPDAVRKWAPRISGVLNAHDHPLCVPILWDPKITVDRWKEIKR